MNDINLNNDKCPCGTGLSYSDCCEPIIKGLKVAQTAEQLMKSRYSAYNKLEIDYIVNSTHISQRHLHSPKIIREWAESCNWLRLEILNTKDGKSIDSTGQVEFKAYYTENSQEKIHHELSIFKKVDGVWYFESGGQPKVNILTPKNTKVGRNDPCTCGSGKKYKKCCG